MGNARRILVLLWLAMLLPFTGLAAPGTPLESVDFGEGVFASEPEFEARDQANALRILQSTLDGSMDQAKRFRAIRFYHKMLPETDAVPRLRDLVIGLRSSKYVRATAETALVIGLLLQDDAAEAKPQYVKDLAAMLVAIRRGQAADPWSHLIAAVLYGTVPELQGNWFDEALYALSLGYDAPEIQLAVGSFLLAMDLSYGGNERLQWFVFLAFGRARQLMPANERLHARIKSLVEANLGIAGYRPSRWLKSLIGP